MQISEIKAIQISINETEASIMHSILQSALDEVDLTAIETDFINNYLEALNQLKSK